MGITVKEYIRKLDRWFRTPKTKNERTQNLKNNSRAKRNMKNVPTDWDDLYISSLDDKSWKNKTKRKTQYRNKKID